MLNIDQLKAIGCDPEEGLARCFGNEALYLKLVKTIPAQENFERLHVSLENGDLDNAFEAAHALKGVLANLSLTSVLTPVEKITELLRERKECDYRELDALIEEKRLELQNICSE